MNISYKSDSILSSCGFEVLCSKLDPLKLSKEAKNLLFLYPFLCFRALRRNHLKQPASQGLFVFLDAK